MRSADFLSLSPTSFQKGNNMLSFSHALEAVKSGKAIQRSGWNGAGLVVKAQFPDATSKMTLPYLYIEYPLTSKTTPGARCPWLASQTDIMAEDWLAVDVVA